MRNIAIVTAAFLTVLAAASPAVACSVCLGDPDSEMVKAAQGGVLVMLVVTYGVLLCFGAMVALWFVRARRLSRATTSPIVRDALQKEYHSQQADV